MEVLQGSEAATTSEQDYVDVDITHLSQELFGESLEKLDPESMEAPKNPVAQETADKVKKDYDAILFAKMVFECLIKVKEQNLTVEEGCIRLKEHFQRLPPNIQDMLAEMYPSLKPIRSSVEGPGRTSKDAVAAKNYLDLRALSNEMFGVEMERLRDNALVSVFA
ncbi:unnamed protein product [Haemonchus placei]|uniref:Protein C10 n=1 Tax=Haemonchus placei TaxID=6290 RepID=A0A0N4X122_HAEPC|nr:unnamed protein product [Haemonchus placei]